MSDDPQTALQDEIARLRERILQLEQALAPEHVSIPIEWGLTPIQAQVFAHLTTRDLATKQSIITAIYSARADAAPDQKIVDVFICHIRRKLKPFGVVIETVWGQGYALRNRARYAGRAAA